MSGDQIIGGIEGTMTFGMVEIHRPEGDGDFKLVGFYEGATTTLTGPAERISIAGFPASLNGVVELTAPPNEWVTVEVTDDYVRVAPPEQ